MSLNWKEIDYIISEWTIQEGKIQQVLQPNPYTLFMEIYMPYSRFQQYHDRSKTYHNVSPDIQQLNFLSIHLTNNMVHIHTTNDRIKKPKVTQRFQQLLQARIIGSYISNIEHVNQDRIIRISLHTPTNNTDDILYLYVKLWSNQANIILTDTHNKIIDLAFRRPKQALMPGETFIIPPRSPNKTNRNTFIRDWNTNEYSTFNCFIEHTYKNRINSEEYQKYIKNITQAFLKQTNILKQKQTRLEQQYEQASKHQELEYYGNLILSNISHIVANDTTLKISSHSAEDNIIKEIAIPLISSLSPVANAQHYFNQAKKAKNIQHSIEKQKASLLQKQRIQHEIKMILESEHVILNKEQEAWLFTKELSTFSSIYSQSRKPHVKIIFQDHPYIIMVGRNAKENDILLRHYVKGNDMWLHIRGHSGAYVFIRTPNKKTISLEMLIQCGQIAALYSKAKHEKYIDIHYTEVKYLKRIKKNKRLVSPLRDKNLTIQCNIEQTKKYLANFMLS